MKLRFVAALLCILVFCQSKAWAALSLDGTPVSANAVATSVTTGTLTTSTGSGLIVVPVISNGAVTSVTGTGLSFTHRIADDVTVGVTNLEVWTAPYASNFSNTITANIGSSVFTTVTAFAIGGAATSSSFDANAGTPGISTSTIPSITTSNTNDFIFTNMLINGGGTGTASAGWTLINGSNFQMVEYLIVSSAQIGLTPGAIGGGFTITGGSIDAVVQATSLVVHNLILLGVGN